MKIESLFGREIYDSRGLPTIECILMLDSGIAVSASVPSGASRSSFEAKELRDGGERLLGMGVEKSVETIAKVIAPVLIGNVPNVVQMDMELLHLDDTDEKSKLGANTMLAVSMAVARAQAVVEELELYELIPYLCGFETVSLPGPMFNLINGGMHADSSLHIQEFMVVPMGVGSFRAAMEVGSTIYYELKDLLKKAGKSTAHGDEGGFASQFTDEQEALDFLTQAINNVDDTHEGNVMIALDVAASQFYNQRTQKYTWHNRQITSDELIEWYAQLAEHYPLYAIEDGLAEDDWDGWHALSKKFGSKMLLVGDDIFATNPQLIWRGIEENVANAVLIKPNQIGTVTETLQSIKLCGENNKKIIVSHRSGETNDTFIADLAVGVSAGGIKAGSVCQGERVAKYNRLLAIEDELLLSC